MKNSSSFIIKIDTSKDITIACCPIDGVTIAVISKSLQTQKHDLCRYSKTFLLICIKKVSQPQHQLQTRCSEILQEELHNIALKIERAVNIPF